MLCVIICTDTVLANLLFDPYICPCETVLFESGSELCCRQVTQIVSGHS